MDSSCQNSDFNVKYLLSQLNTARREINNLRQQIKSLRYVHEKEVDDIKHVLESYKNGTSISEATVISSEDVKPSTSSNDETLKLKPIGVVCTWFPNKRGTPRQPGICGRVPGRLVLYNTIFTNPEHALEGLQDFSHMWILFYFHRNDSTHVRAKVAPPRLNGTRTGVFSTRSPHRPCPIGLSLVKIIRIENHVIYFEGVDMVDQTPVLDIKPYIPQYDSPAYFENICNRLQGSNINNPDMFECIEDTATLSRDEISSSLNIDVNSGLGYRNSHLDFYHKKGYNKIHQNTDVSKDEEIALGLQAEEFQENTNSENYNNTRQLPRSANSNLHNNSTLNVTNTHDIRHIVQDISYNARADLNTALPHNTLLPNLESQSETLAYVSDRLQNVSISDQANMDSVYTLRSRENSHVDSHASRNSRLLDGADGPSTVCGTDLDLINRRSLNSRIDNSPVRMGIREAPDGEEGMESRTLTPSQTLPNFQIARTVSNSNLLESTDATLNSTSEQGSIVNRPQEINVSEVRVPEWISRPRTPLCVVFNDRALIQLNEILGTKINDQKSAIENVLREDPRSVYLRQRWGSQFYTFLIHDLHITCRFDDNRGVVTVFQVRHAGRICECGEPEWQCLGHSPIS